MALKLGFRPKGQTDAEKIAEYTSKSQQGMERAKDLLRWDNRTVLDPDTIKAVNEEILREIYPKELNVAGHYTKTRMRLGDSKEYVDGAVPNFIDHDLEDLTNRYRRRFEDAKTDRERIDTSVGYLVEFKKIQAFPDANGRTSGVLLDHLLSRSLKHEITLNLNAGTFHHELWKAIKYDKPEPLKELIRNEVKKQMEQALGTDPRLAEAQSVEPLLDQAKDGELWLSKGQVEQLSTEAVKGLLQSSGLERINGKDCEFLRDAFAFRPKNPDKAAESVKEYLLEGLEDRVRLEASADLRLTPQPEQEQLRDRHKTHERDR